MRIQFKTLVFNCLVNINKVTGRRFITSDQLCMYVNLLNEEFKKKDISVIFCFDLINFQLDYSDLVHVCMEGLTNQIYIMLPWVDITELVMNNGGPMLSDIYNIMNDSKIIKKVASMDRVEELRIRKIQRNVEEYYIMSVKKTIEDYVDNIDREQKKIDKYVKIKLLERKDTDY